MPFCNALQDTHGGQVADGQSCAAVLSEELFHVSEVIGSAINRDVGLKCSGKAAALDSEGAVSVKEGLGHGIGQGDSLLGGSFWAVDVLKISER